MEESKLQIWLQYRTKSWELTYNFLKPLSAVVQGSDHEAIAKAVLGEECGSGANGFVSYRCRALTIWEDMPFARAWMPNLRQIVLVTVLVDNGTDHEKLLSDPDHCSSQYLRSAIKHLQELAGGKVWAVHEMDVGSGEDMLYSPNITLLRRWERMQDGRVWQWICRSLAMRNRALLYLLILISIVQYKVGSCADEAEGEMGGEFIAMRDCSLAFSRL
ncbi:hypothetical protein DFS33DRAFT_1278630 [Desarmillaria ectypa]|nr:hypothetical protein DFS33DRAFT_1278630 [Desarmillaria ectypa]